MSDPDPEYLEPHDPEGWDERFARQGRGVRQVLQAVEDALVDGGYDDFAVATDRGTFRWQTVERARAELAEDAAKVVTQEGWEALRMIRDAVEELGPPGAIRSEEAVLKTLGPEMRHEAQAIVEGIQALAAAAHRKTQRGARGGQ